MNLSTKFDYSKVNYSQENVVNLLISAKAPKLDISQRKPINIIAVTDTSGSMGGSKLEYAKKSLMKMIDHLSPADTLGIVLFDGFVRVLAVPAKMTQEVKDSLKAQVLQIHAGGSTNFAGGMLEALRMAGKTDGDCRVIMFTDGEATDGATTLPQLTEILRNNMQKNTTLSCFGYGANHVSAILLGLADVGKGNYAFVQNPDDALTAFARELGGLLSCYAQNLKFKVSGTEGVKITEVRSDVTVEQLGDEIKITLPDLYSEETRHLVLELLLPKQKKAFPRETAVALVQLEFDNKEGKAEKVETKAKVSYVKAADVLTVVDKDVANQLALASICKAQVRAQEFALRGNYREAQNCFMNVNLGDTTEEIRGFAKGLSANYSDGTLYAASAHSRDSSRYALRTSRMSGVSGQAAGAAAPMAFMANSVQSSLMNSFAQGEAQVGADGRTSSGVVTTTAGGVDSQTGANVTVTQAGHPQPDSVSSDAQKNKTEKKLTKKRSQTQW